MYFNPCLQNFPLLSLNSILICRYLFHQKNGSGRRRRLNQDYWRRPNFITGRVSSHNDCPSYILWYPVVSLFSHAEPFLLRIPSPNFSFHANHAPNSKTVSFLGSSTFFPTWSENHVPTTTTKALYPSHRRRFGSFHCCRIHGWCQTSQSRLSTRYQIVAPLCTSIAVVDNYVRWHSRATHHGLPGNY